MGKAVCTIGSEFKGYCNYCEYDVTGKMITGEAGFTIEGKDICVTGSEGVGSCGHKCRAVGSSEVWKINGKQVARVGDLVDGQITGKLTKGSDFVTAD